MRVLIVHRYFWPENVTVTAETLRCLAELHAGRGADVRVVTGASRDFSAEYQAAFGTRVHVAALHARIDREGGLLRRLLTSVRLLVCGLRHVTGTRKWDIVYLVSYPPFLAAILAIWGRAFGRVRHVVYSMQDNFVYRVPTGLLQALYRQAQRWTIRRASGVITLSEEMKAELVSWFPPAERPAIERRIHVIQNFASGLQQGPRAASPQPARDIVFAGNHGSAQNLHHFIDILASPIVDPKPRVAFFGSGSAREGLIAHAERAGLDGTVAFHPSIGRDEIREEIARSRFGLVGARPDLMRYAFPSKLLAYAAEGTASLVMCAGESHVSSWLAATGFGHALDPVSAETGARQLQSLLCKEDGAGDRAARAARAAEDFGRERYLREIGAMLDGLS